MSHPLNKSWRTGILLCAIWILSSATCSKNAIEQHITGKLIYRSCATTVVTIIDSQYHNLAQSDWQQNPGSPVMHNVFSVVNTCGLTRLDSGEVFTFKVIPPESSTDCAVFMMYDNPPQKSLTIKVLR